LGNELELDFSSVKLLLKIFRTRAGESRDHSADLLILEKNAEFAFVCAAIIADNTEILRALPSQSLDQIVGKAGTAEPAKHDRCAIRYVSYSGID
jgi:hypothetical protein